MTLADLNAKDCRAFTDALGWIFEDSPWVATAAWELRPFDSLDALHEAMIAVVAATSREQQLALLRAHPELGAVRLKQEPRISRASQREQDGAGLTALTNDEIDRLSTLNAAYRGKFGYPFLYAVQASTKDDVLSALERRLHSTRDAEQQEALRQVYRIARFRLEKALQ
jgi:2-oxo-4-hydroxy-4-carboxy-5-ureidoimidazoline decarboxylase